MDIFSYLIKLLSLPLSPALLLSFSLLLFLALYLSHTHTLTHSLSHTHTLSLSLSLACSLSRSLALSQATGLWQNAEFARRHRVVATAKPPQCRRVHRRRYLERALQGVCVDC